MPAVLCSHAVADTNVCLDYVGNWWCGVTKLCLTLVTLWTIAHQASMSVEFSRQVYWSGLLLFSCSVVCDSLQPQGIQHARLPCPLPLLELAQTHVHWVGDAIQPSHPLLSPSPVFNLSQHQGQMSQFFTSGGQSIGPSTAASVLPMNIQDLFPLGWTVLISLQSKGLSRVFSTTTVQKHQFLGAQLSL